MAMRIRAGSPPFFLGSATALLPPTAMPPQPLPFSLKKLRRQVDELDAFVKSAAIDTMELEMTTEDFGLPFNRRR